MTSHADVQGASEALILHDCGWVLLYAGFMVVLPTEGQQAPFYIFPTALAHKTGMDPWRKSSRCNISHMKGLNEDPTLPSGYILAEHNFPTGCTYPKAQVSAAGLLCLQLQRNSSSNKSIILAVISGKGTVRRKPKPDNPT